MTVCMIRPMVYVLQWLKERPRNGKTPDDFFSIVILGENGKLHGLEWNCARS